MIGGPSSQQQRNLRRHDSQKLKNCLERILKMEMRDATQRLAGEGDKVKGEIKKIFTTLQKMPKTETEKWRNMSLLAATKTSLIT